MVRFTPQEQRDMESIERVADTLEADLNAFWLGLPSGHPLDTEIYTIKRMVNVIAVSLNDAITRHKRGDNA